MSVLVQLISAFVVYQLLEQVHVGKEHLETRRLFPQPAKIVHLYASNLQYTFVVGASNTADERRKGLIRDLLYEIHSVRTPSLVRRVTQRKIVRQIGCDVVSPERAGEVGLLHR